MEAVGPAGRGAEATLVGAAVVGAGGVTGAEAGGVTGVGMVGIVGAEATVVGAAPPDCVPAGRRSPEPRA